MKQQILTFIVHFAAVALSIMHLHKVRLASLCCILNSFLSYIFIAFEQLPYNSTTYRKIESLSEASTFLDFRDCTYSQNVKIKVKPRPHHLSEERALIAS